MRLLILILSLNAHAIIQDPILHAANALGFQIADEIEYVKGYPYTSQKRARAVAGQVQRRCPAHDWNSLHVVLIAWSDREYPSPHSRRLSEIQVSLAAKRGNLLMKQLKPQLGDSASIEVVNMASREPHLLRLPYNAPVQSEKFNIKAALEIAGAAPTGDYDTGLFGEYGQSAKVVVWVNCTEPTLPAPRRQASNFKLAWVNPPQIDGAKSNSSVSFPF